MGPVLGHPHHGQRDVTDLTALEADAVALPQRLAAPGTGRWNVVLGDIGISDHAQPGSVGTRLTSPLAAALQHRLLLRSAEGVRGRWHR